MASTPQYDRLMDAVKQAVALIPSPRDRAVIEHRFGLGGKRETLNEVGQRFHLTRERIRQVENSTLRALRGVLAADPVPEVSAAIEQVTDTIDDMGQAASVDALATRVVGESTTVARGVVMLLSELSPHLVVMAGNANYHASIVHSDTLDKRAVRAQIDTLVAALQKHGQPVALADWPGIVETPSSAAQVAAIASLSKEIIHKGDEWGLPQWAIMNPHNIRDLAYILLRQVGEPMHYSAIADAVNAGAMGASAFSRKVVHNGLIKDPRFVLIGRGKYALAEWGYTKGSLPDVIAGVLRQESPLSSDEIVRRVMQVRHLQDRTIRMSLHAQPQFRRVAKAEYVLDETARTV